MLSDSPGIWDHIVLIAGDISQPKLGISEEDEKTLVEDVSIVFHLAATVQFNTTLRDAIQYNVVGVQEVVKLCHKMTKLEVKYLCCYFMYYLSLFLCRVLYMCHQLIVIVI